MWLDVTFVSFLTIVVVAASCLLLFELGVSYMIGVYYFIKGLVPVAFLAQACSSSALLIASRSRLVCCPLERSSLLTSSTDDFAAMAPKVMTAAAVAAKAKAKAKAAAKAKAKAKTMSRTRALAAAAAAAAERSRLTEEERVRSAWWATMIHRVALRNELRAAAGLPPLTNDEVDALHNRSLVIRWDVVDPWRVMWS